LQQAAEGVFSARAVSQLPADLLRRHFSPRPGGWSLDPWLLSRIHFARLNLVSEPFPDLGAPFDFVFLRNVLIYFRAASQRRVVEAVARNLAPDGYLFLGHSESLWQLSGRLTPVDLGGCFAYRHGAPSPPLPPVKVDVVTALPSGQPAPPAPARPIPAAARRTPLPPRTVAPAADEPPLAGAVAALEGNRIAIARELVARRLEAEPEDAAAHALGGLIHELQGDDEGAIAAYRAALFLRPELYRVRFQLAERLRLGGWRERARAEYSRVLTSLREGAGELPDLAALLPEHPGELAERCRAALSRLRGVPAEV
jgi:chemotaxis protein methyltransferase CheR